MGKWKRILKMFLFDILGYLVAMGTFLAIFYLVPYNLEADGTIVGDSENMAQFDVPVQFQSDDVQGSADDSDDSADNESDEENNESGNDEESNSHENQEHRPGRGDKNNGGSGGSGKYDHLGTEEIEADESEAENMVDADADVTVLEEYSTDNVHLTLEKKVVGSGNDTVTYYVADVYVSSLKYIRTALAEGEYGTNIKQDVDDIADENDAIFAITGDSYGNNTTGIVIRDGVLYRDDENDADVCLLYTDGTMKTYTASEFDEESVKEDDVWQAWCFGPALLDGEGNVLSQFTTTSYLSNAHPRVAIGYVAPGHYVFVVVDGRDEGYSRGATLSELAAIMKKEGCLVAYNLDGGGSSSMLFDGKYVNKSTGRDISDIIYIPEE